MEEKNENVLYSNYLLPPNFINRWRNGPKEKFVYLDFASEIATSVAVDNQPFLQKLFSFDASFDKRHIEKQFEQIAQVARKIVDIRILKKDKVKLKKQEILFLKYFNFLISLINGDYKFYFEGLPKAFRSFDAISDKVDAKIRHKILTVINYGLFQLYDSLFSDQLFSPKLQKYVDESRINFAQLEIEKRLVVPDEELKNQSYRFLQAYFFQFVNNTFLKIFAVNELDRNTFFLTNKSIVNFIDDRTKMTLLNVLVIDPYYALGFVNLGPGRGEYRPFFQYFVKTELNQVMIPAALYPEHEVRGTGVYLDEAQEYFFTPFEITPQQVELLNEGLTYRQLKFGLDSFYKVK